MPDHLRDIFYSLDIREGCEFLNTLIQENLHLQEKISYPKVASPLKGKDYLLYRYLKRGHFADDILGHPCCNLEKFNQEWQKERVKLFWKF
jgi:hypothetical protein